MTETQVRQLLAQPQFARQFFLQLGVRNADRAVQNLATIVQRRIPIPLFASFLDQLSATLNGLSDPDRALNNLERFVSAARSPLALLALFEREPTAIPILLRIFSDSQHFGDLLIRDGESYDSLRLTEGQPLSRDGLVTELCEEIGKVQTAASAMNLLRRFKQRQTLRIAYGDLVGKQRTEEIAQQISYVADAVCAAAVEFCRGQLVEKFGVPRHEDGEAAEFSVLALGKLGGEELNYSSDIDLITFYSADGSSDGRRSISNHEYFERLARDFVKLLVESTELGMAYRVDLRLRPDGAQGPISISQANLLHYYDVRGRTWERQALIKARWVAGDRRLAESTLAQLENWIYRKYLTRFEIQGIKALKRQIERKVELTGEVASNIKTGHGGIRDIEFVIQFLQLLHGSDRRVRTHNTVTAIERLCQAGCLTMKEADLLRENYCWLRKLEHRLQIMFDLQTHSLPSDQAELERVANRMDLDSNRGNDPLTQFQIRLAATTEVNRKILNHLMHHAFPADDTQVPAEEVDLILDRDPSPDRIERILSRYSFADPRAAYRHLLSLSDEKIPFLNPRRCRHFFAAIAQALLEAIGQTPQPDATLLALDNISSSIGGKAVLWELFSYNRPSMQLCVKLCAACSYLTEILTRHPGMIDGLLDSLTLRGLPSTERIRNWLDELTRNADDPQPILVGFKNHMHLQIGVRDILGRDRIAQTHRALADVAELCVQSIAARQWTNLVERFGQPYNENGQPCGFVILSMGKLGGREPNYHSDLDVIFLYEQPGSTRHPVAARQTSNQHFFSELGSKIIKAISSPGRYGKLYELDCRLRPTGKSGSLAVSFDEFDRYFREGEGQTWERLALCKARPIFGAAAVQSEAMRRVRAAMTSAEWQPAWAEEIRQMRYRMQEGASRLNLKRGVGGTVDVEFIVQAMQLKFAAHHANVVRPGTVESIVTLQKLGIVAKSDCRYLLRSYQLLRSVEARIRLMHTEARHDFPIDNMARQKLAYLLNRKSGPALQREVERYLVENRACFERIFNQLARPT